MKKITLLFVVLFTTILTAQETENKPKLVIEKGTFLITGSIGINKQETKSDFLDDRESERFNFQLSPGISVINNLMLGLNLGYSKTESVFFDSGLYLVGPYIKYYVPINSKLAFSFNGSFSYGKGDTKSKPSIIDEFSTTTENDIDSYNFGIETEINYFITKKLSIDLSLLDLSYSSITREDRSGIKTEDTNLNFSTISNNVIVGVSFFF